MQQPKRIELIAAVGFKYVKPRTVSEVLLTPDAHAALKELEKLITQARGQLKINSVYRSWAKQQELFDLHAKQPKVYPVASAPGKSYHQAGRAIDFAINELNFVGVTKEKWLDKFWDIAKPLGFTPIILKPNESESEAWHFDFKGCWSAVSEKIGYLKAAQCAILDVGNWNPNEDLVKEKRMFCQAQLLRLGFFEIGDIDGILGKKSIECLKKIGYDKNVTDIDVLVEFMKRKT